MGESKVNLDMIGKHLISKETTIRESLKLLNDLSIDAILFIVDNENRLLGSLTDGDLRRGFISGLGFENSIMDFVQLNPIFVRQNDFSLDALEPYIAKNYKIFPILNNDDIVVDILNFRTRTTIIPADAVLMAGGEGKRLRPLTELVPKPLLMVGGKPIIEYNIDRLIKVGVDNMILSINYLGEQLEEYFKDGSSKGIQIGYVKESKPLGTIGSILLIDTFKHDDIIVMNSDLLTNIDFVDFYKTYKKSGADMAVATTSYHVDVPYAVLETGENNIVRSLKEKPKYTYYSNAGIYILKKELLSMIPKDVFFDITDLMEKAIEMSHEIIAYPINGYWLDIGRHEDYKKAQEDINHLKF